MSERKLIATIALIATLLLVSCASAPKIQEAQGKITTVTVRTQNIFTGDKTRVTFYKDGVKVTDPDMIAELENKYKECVTTYYQDGVEITDPAKLSELDSRQKEAMAKHNQAMVKHDEAMAKHDQAMLKHDDMMKKHDEMMAKHNEQIARHNESTSNQCEIHGKDMVKIEEKSYLLGAVKYTRITQE